MRNLVHITIPVKGGDALETWRKYFNEIPGPCWAGPLVPEERDPSYFDQIPKPSLEGSVQDTVEWGYHLRGMWPFWAARAAISGLATLTPEGAESTTDGLHYGLGQLFIKVMSKYKKWSIWGALWLLIFLWELYIVEWQNIIESITSWYVWTKKSFNRILL